MQLVAPNPVTAKILKRNENGSGVVRMPILRVARFESGPYTGQEISAENLRQAAENFGKWPGPVPINVTPHRDFGADANAVPGFIESMRVVGDVLMADIFLVAGLFSEVEAGMWRGFSVDIWESLALPTVKFDGSVISGGVFTNRPATDVNFKIAAAASHTTDPPTPVLYEIDSSTPHTGMFLEFRLNAEKEPDMADETKTVSALEAEVDKGKEKISTLEAELAKAKSHSSMLQQQVETMTGTDGEKVARLEEMRKDLSAANVAKAEAESKVATLQADLTKAQKAVTDLENDKKALAVRLEAEENRSLRDNVMKSIHASIDRGVSAKLFEGVEEDPVKWFESRYKSLEALTEWLEALPTVQSSATTSGKKSDAGTDLSTEDQKTLKRMGIDPKFTRIRDENDLRERLED